MKKIFTILAAIASTFAFAQEPCVDGSSNGNPCENYGFQSRLSLGNLGASGGNDSWGWTDPDNGDEYALVGVNNGTAFVDITDPANPVYLGKLPTHTSNSTWRDIKVYNDHAFVVSEANGHGMQVFDLTRLRNVNNPPVTFTEDAHYGGFGDAHNIVINEDTGYAYPVGSDFYNGGPLFINIQDPLNPQDEGGYSLDGYTHDAQVVVYNGPDADHVGKEIFVGSNGGAVVVVDITNKAAPVPLSSTNYPNVGYTHQGWFTEDQQYFIVGDEADEFNVGFNTRSIVFDMTDLDNPQVDFEYFGTTPAVDHNGYVLGDKYYMANYSAGLRVLDLSNIESGTMTEYGYFDSYTPNDNASFDGAWNVYPYFPSGSIIISGDNGLTVVRDDLLAVDAFQQNDFVIYPNPAHNDLTISSNDAPINSVAIYNVLGQQVLQFEFAASPSEEINISSLDSGVYIVQINGTTAKRLVVK